MLLSMVIRKCAMAAILFLISLPGCGIVNDSAAMRIEVEVYKGPLSLEPEIQLGELYGYLTEAQNGLINTSKFISRVLNLVGLEASLNDLCGASNASISQQLNCSLLTALTNDAASLELRLAVPLCALRGESDHKKCLPEGIFQYANLKLPNGENFTGVQWTEILSAVNKQLSELPLSSPNRKSASSIATGGAVDYRQALLESTRIAAAMQAKAFYYATASTAGQSADPVVRIATAYFIAATSEYGNQIQARADSLLKQLGTEGRDRRELPLSAHLREAEPTDFMHLFDWTDGHLPRLYDYVHFNFSPNLEERIKIVDRLYADHFWSKINTVYASGRGKAQMAFIKDETGNWNLKSFDNDPTELLDAYTKVTKSALEGVVEIAGEIASGGADAGFKKAADELLAIARQTDPDKPLQATPSGGALSLNHLRARIDGQLKSTHVRTDLNKDKELIDKVKIAKEASDEVKASLEKAKQDSTLNTQILAEEEKTAGTALANAQKDLAAHRKTVIEKWAALIDDHSQLVDLLSSTVTKQ